MLGRAAPHAEASAHARHKARAGLVRTRLTSCRGPACGPRAGWPAIVGADRTRL
jgi:hypothetical protein